MSHSRLRLAEASRVLKPYEQGSLDGLCGIYSVVNAIQLVIYPERLTRGAATTLIEAGFIELQRMRKLHTTLVSGMYLPTWRKAAAAMVARANPLLGTTLLLEPVVLKRGSTVDRAVRHIRHALWRGRPVLVQLDGALDHWTVVARYSRTRLSLVDSAGHRWVLTENVGLAGQPTRHQIARGGLYVLRRA